MSLDSVQFSRRSLLLGTLAVCCGCRSVPLTERKQILFSSEESEASLGLAAYQQVLKDSLSEPKQDCSFKRTSSKVPHLACD